MVWAEETNEADRIEGDRRDDRRYDLRLDMRWKVIRRRRVLETGTGVTIDVSSGGVLFETARPLPAGLNIELSVSWPVLLHDVAPLQLVVFGRIVRAEGNRAAVRMAQHEFRTVGIPADHRSVLATATRNPSAYLHANGPAGLGKIQ